VKATGWLRGLEVAAGGTGIVSHAGLALLRALSDKRRADSGPVEGAGFAAAAGS
jgi:hypothetical protein